MPFKPDQTLSFNQDLDNSINEENNILPYQLPKFINKQSENNILQLQKRRGSTNIQYNEEDEYQDQLQEQIRSSIDTDNVNQNQRPLKNHHLLSKRTTRNNSYRLNYRKQGRNSLTKNLNLNQSKPEDKNQKNKEDIFTVTIKRITAVQNVKIFARKLKNLIQYLLIRELHDRHFQIINDKSYYNDTQMNKWKNCQQQVTKLCFPSLVNKFLNKKFILNPTQSQVIWLQVLFMAIIVYNIIQIPIQVAFKDSQYGFLNWINISFFFEILLSLNVGYYSEGQLITNRYRIAKHYIGKGFVLDLLAFFSYNMIAFRNQEFCSTCIELTQLVRLAYYFRIKRFNIYGNSLDDHFNIRSRSLALWELGKLLIIISSVVNLVGCGFYYIGQLQSQGQSWLDAQEIRQQAWTNQYLYSVYFACITMVTVGYGDIYPKTDQEIIYVIIVTYFSTAIFAYAVNIIGAILNEQVVKDQKFKRQQYLIRKFLQERRISRELQLSITKYLEYKDIMQGRSNEQGLEILQLCSLNLQNDFLYEYYGNILKKTKLFSLNFTQEFLKQLSLQAMQEKILYPGEVIIKENQCLDKLYIILQGDIQIEVNGKYFAVLQKDRILGYQSFFGNQIGQYTAKSIHRSKIISIDKHIFNKLLKDYPLDFQRKCTLHDNLTLYDKQFSQKCFSCGEFSHFHTQCPLLIYNISKYLLLKKHNLHIPQERQNNIDRGYQKMTNSLSIQNQLQKDVLQFKIEILKALNHYDEEIKLIQESLTQQIQNVQYYQGIVIQLPNIKYNQGKFQIDIDDEESFDSQIYEIIQQNSSTLQNIGLGQNKEVQTRRKSSTFSMPRQQFSNQFSKIKKRTSPTINFDDDPFLNFGNSSHSQSIIQQFQPIIQQQQQQQQQQLQQLQQFQDNNDIFQQLQFNQQQQDNTQIMNRKLSGFNSINNSQQSKIDVFFIYEFDKQKHYSHYFSHNNMEFVLEKLNKKLTKIKQNNYQRKRKNRQSVLQTFKLFTCKSKSNDTYTQQLIQSPIGQKRTSQSECDQNEANNNNKNCIQNSQASIQNQIYQSPLSHFSRQASLNNNKNYLQQKSNPEQVINYPVNDGVEDRANTSSNISSLNNNNNNNILKKQQQQQQQQQPQNCLRRTSILKPKQMKKKLHFMESTK